MAAEFGVAVLLKSGETHRLDFASREAKSLPDALDLIREVVAKDPEWHAITLVRGEDLEKLIADADAGSVGPVSL